MNIDINNQLPADEFIIKSPSITIIGDNYKNLEILLQRIQKLALNKTIIIKVEDKEKFNKYALYSNEIIKNNITIDLQSTSGKQRIPIIDYLKYEKWSYEIIKPALELSPFERYIFAYNIAKKFRKYKKETDPKDIYLSRDLYKLLNEGNDLIVCNGFVNLFSDLLTKLHIPNFDISMLVDPSYDQVIKEGLEIEKSVEKGKHARVYAYIEDEKYGINGFYTGDPTWDNDMENDYYSHLALTALEVAGGKRYVWNQPEIEYNKMISTIGIAELLNVESIEEFFEKINIILNRWAKSIREDQSLESPNIIYSTDEKTRNSMINEEIAKTFPMLIDKLIKRISLLDKKSIDKFMIKYPFLKETINNWPQNLSDLVTDIGEYIVSRVNNEIRGETIMDALSAIYKKINGYTDEEIASIIARTIEANRERQELAFPKRYRTDANGNSEIIMNEVNKFDINPEQRSM